MDNFYQSSVPALKNQPGSSKTNREKTKTFTHLAFNRENIEKIELRLKDSPTCELRFCNDAPLHEYFVCAATKDCSLLLGRLLRQKPELLQVNIDFADIKHFNGDSDDLSQADPHISGPFTALSAAAYAGQTAVITLLLQYGYNLEYDPADTLMAMDMAVKNGHNEIVKMLLNAGPNNYTFPNINLLLTAVKNGRDEVLHTLLDHSNKQFTNSEFWDAFEEALTKGQWGVIVVLLSHCETINIIMKYLRTYTVPYNNQSQES